MRKGFTLIEVLMVTGILVILFGVGLWLGFDNYRNYILSSETHTLSSIIRRSQAFAISNQAGIAHGIFIDGNGVVLFRGMSYALRDPAFDEIYERSGVVTASGTDEFAFSPLSGFPVATGTIELSNGLRSQTLSLNAYGTLFW